MDTVSAFLKPILKEEVDKRLSCSPILDPKSHLQEIVQEAKGTLAYSIVSESGPDHDKRFVMEVLINSNVLAEGVGHSKKLAEQAAAKAALELMGQ